MKITIARSGTDTCVYRDRRLVWKENREITPMELLEVLGIYGEIKEVDLEWLESYKDGQIPSLIDQVKFK